MRLDKSYSQQSEQNFQTWVELLLALLHGQLCIDCQCQSIRCLSVMCCRQSLSIVIC